MERIPTGIAELDEKISGGYPKSKAMLITGAPGTGKTIFGLHLPPRSMSVISLHGKTMPNDPIWMIHGAIWQTSNRILIFYPQVW